MNTTDSVRTNRIPTGAAPAASLFARAARVFDGWTDPETGLRVLRIRAKGPDAGPPARSTV